jgi:hypothetical protein
MVVAVAEQQNGIDGSSDEGRRPRQGELLVICADCGGRCYADKSERRFTRYYCEHRCGFSRKIPRPE